ncbi:amidohydrolase family protein [Parvibaculum sp.]|uniref:amidohydrolase family protein n=1 Tax=Parvibaculum sp. TaxID=2024848 RepID=UPI00391B12BA
MAGNPEWLAKVTEAALEPALPIIDPHHHLWVHPGSRYELEELLDDTGQGHNIRATVFVECKAMYRADGPEHLKPVGETEYVNGIAAKSASGGFGEMRACAGIVGFADLRLGSAVDEVLEAHIAAAPARFRGIRHASAFDASPEVRPSHTNPPEGLLGLEDFREGFKRLAKYNMTFDAWLYHRQIPELTSLARANPQTTIIFDHFGGPIGIGPYEGKRAEIFAQWKKDVADLASCPNVVAKLGGINMAVNGFGWHKRALPPTSDELVAATRDWYLHSIDVFGPARCMFESNFPVDKLSCSYGVVWNAFKKIASGFSADEKRHLFHDTAARVYRIAAA